MRDAPPQPDGRCCGFQQQAVQCTHAAAAAGLPPPPPRYPVSDRANAVRQFFDAAKQDPELIQAPWIYMIESDYVRMFFLGGSVFVRV